MTNLRDFGMGKKSCEEKIIEECDHLVEVFRRFKGQCPRKTNHIKIIFQTWVFISFFFQESLSIPQSL